MIQNVSSIISAVAVVVGLAFAGVQLGFLRRQLEDGQKASRAAELRATNGMDPKLQYLIEAPELRGHFYSDQALPEDDTLRNQILMISEAYADRLDLGVKSAAATKIPAAVKSWSWEDDAEFILKNAPGVRLLVEEHPMWWPELTENLKSLPHQPDASTVGESADPSVEAGTHRAHKRA